MATRAKKSRRDETAVQAGRFGLVGILNTLIDFVLFQLLTKLFSVPLSQVWIPKEISGLVAMANSYYFNRKWVFHSQNKLFSPEVVRFLIVTIIGVLIIQAGLVQYFSNDFPAIGRLTYDVIDYAGITGLLPQVLTQAFIIKTVAFGIATAVSMVWNFLAYKFWAFRPA